MTATMKPLSVSIAVCDRGLRQTLQGALQSFPASLVITQDMGQKGSDLAAAAAISRPGVLVADLGSLGESFGDTIRALRSQANAPDVIVLHNALDGGAVLTAMRAGAREFFFEDIETNLRLVVAAIAAESQGQNANGQLYAFIAAKGGCGVTTIASYAAASMARLPNTQVMLADLHWASPSAAFLLRSEPRYNLQSALLEMDRMDDKMWGAMVSPTAHGFVLAPPPEEKGNHHPVDACQFRRLLQFCKTQYGSIVADCGHGFNHLTPTLLEAASQTVLITSTDVVALHHTKRLLRLIQEVPGAPPLRLVLNRTRTRPDMTQAELEKMLGYPIFASVPNEYRPLIQASEEGAMLAPQHSFSQSVSAIAMQLTGTAPELKKKRFGMFNN